MTREWMNSEINILFDSPIMTHEDLAHPRVHLIGAYPPALIETMLSASPTRSLLGLVAVNYQKVL